MTHDFKSSFCSRETFIPSLKALIERADSEYVILSYFDGRNHWGSFKAKNADTEGKRLLSEFFSSDLFVSSSVRCVPLGRTNYQSYGGFSAKAVQEFLFVAQKRKSPLTRRGLGGDGEWIGRGSAFGTT